MTIKLFASDFDDTLIPIDGDEHAAAQAFSQFWQSLSHPPVLVINSGRMATDLIHAVNQHALPAPDYFIGGVGTEIYDAAGVELPQWRQHLADSFDRTIADAVMQQFPAATPQPDEFQSAYKSSWHWFDCQPSELQQLEAALAQANCQTKVVYSSDRDLDILPAQADKGQALMWLARYLKISHEEIVVAGDTGNDVAMFAIPGAKSIMVGNARAELRAAATAGGFHTYSAAEACTAGVIEGIKYFMQAPSLSGEDLS